MYEMSTLYIDVTHFYRPATRGAEGKQMESGQASKSLVALFVLLMAASPWNASNPTLLDPELSVHAGLRSGTETGVLPDAEAETSVVKTNGTQGLVEVTIFRAGGSAGTKKSVFVDGVEVARLPRNRYFTILLESGRTRINAENFDNEAIHVDLGAGDRDHHYIEVYEKFFANGADVREVFSSRARSRIRRLQYIPFEWIYDRDRILLPPLER